MGSIISVLICARRIHVKNEECPICLDDLEKFHVKILDCKLHGLHKKCYREMIKKYDKCPLCEHKLDPDERSTICSDYY